MYAMVRIDAREDAMLVFTACNDAKLESTVSISLLNLLSSRPEGVVSIQRIVAHTTLRSSRPKSRREAHRALVYCVTIVRTLASDTDKPEDTNVEERVSFRARK